MGWTEARRTRRCWSSRNCKAGLALSFPQRGQPAALIRERQPRLASAATQQNLPRQCTVHPAAGSKAQREFPATRSAPDAGDAHASPQPSHPNPGRHTAGTKGALRARGCVQSRMSGCHVQPAWPPEKSQATGTAMRNASSLLLRCEEKGSQAASHHPKAAVEVA